MFIRRKTLERLLNDQARTAAAERRELLQVISQQADRIMYLAGKPWDTPPSELPTGVLPDDEFEDTVDPSDLPDDLGFDPY